MINRTILRRTCHIGLLWVACLGLCAQVSVASAAEQGPWEVSPFRAMVWLDLDVSCHADPEFAARLQRQLQDIRYATSGAVWDTTVMESPLKLDRWYAPDADPTLFAERMRQQEMNPEKWDRVMLISIAREDVWKIDFREYDSMTRSWGSHHQRSVGQRVLVPTETLKLAYENFLPLTRIINIDKKEVTMSLKGATLVEEELLARRQRYQAAVEYIPPTEDEKINWNQPPDVAASEASYPDLIPGTVAIGEAFQPVLRRNDRQGNLVKENGIAFMPWTYINCESNNGVHIKGTMVSGFNTPIPGRRNVRTQRIAIGIRPANASTKLKLVDKTSESTPLAGYEIYSKDPSGANLIGSSNPNGLIDIPTTAECAVRLLYVRSGGNLLARLPVVPGHDPTLTARVTNDTPRLLAEGYLEGWRDQLVDTMARRQILVQRVRRKLDAGDLDAANKWLEELRASRTINELAFELRTAKGQFLKDKDLDPSIKRRIDNLFEKGQKLVSQDKSVLTEATLAQQLDEAEKKN